MKIKYEAVFGDQSLFDNDIGDSVAAINHGDVVFCFNSYNTFLIEVMKCNDLPLSDIPEFAMRRIIPEPKRWTMQDKLAGRLPEVGSMILFINDTKQVEFAGTDGGNKLWYFKRDSGAFGSAYFNCFKPIESPEEKAARLRSEWCNRAMDYSTIQQLYDAMLSGDLPVPSKDNK